MSSVASACAIPLGYNLVCPKPLHYTFEVLQKVLMQLDNHKMSQSAESLLQTAVLTVINTEVLIVFLLWFMLFTDLTLNNLILVTDLSSFEYVQGNSGSS